MKLGERMEQDKEFNEYVFNEYKIKSNDRNGRRIEEIERKIPDMLVVYFIKGDYFSLGIDMRDDLDIRLPKEFELKMNELNHLLSDKSRKKKKYKFIRDSFSSAYLSIVNQIDFYDPDADFSNLDIKFDSEVAIEYFNNAIERLKKINRKNFIFGLLGPSLILALVSFIMYRYDFVDINPDMKIAVYSMLFSNLGSGLRELLQVSRLESFNTIGLIDGLLDFLKSSISGILLYLVMKANLILGVFANDIFAVLAFALASGFNEDIPLKIIGKLSDRFLSNEEVIDNE